MGGPLPQLPAGHPVPVVGMALLVVGVLRGALRAAAGHRARRGRPPGGDHTADVGAQAGPAQAALYRYGADRLPRRARQEGLGGRSRRGGGTGSGAAGGSLAGGRPAPAEAGVRGLGHLRAVGRAQDPGLAGQLPDDRRQALGRAADVLQEEDALRRPTGGSARRGGRAPLRAGGTRRRPAGCLAGW
jgi:hypothetical protein